MTALVATAARMVAALPGANSTEVRSTDDIATATMDALHSVVPPTVAGIASLSGGQGAELATGRLAAGQAALAHRVSCNVAALAGAHRPVLEQESVPL